MSPTIRVVREPAHFISTIWRHEGQPLRAAPEFANAGLTLRKIAFETEQPGYFGPANLVCDRPRTWDVMDAQLLASVNSDDNRGSRVHEGRIVGVPRTGVNEITIELEGWSKHAEDRDDVHMIFADRDLNSWFTATQQIKAGYGNQWKILDAQVVHDPEVGRPGIELVAAEDVANMTLGGGAETIMQYDGGPGLVKRIDIIKWFPSPWYSFSAPALTVYITTDDWSSFENNSTDFYDSGGMGPAWHSMTATTPRRMGVIDFTELTNPGYPVPEKSGWCWACAYGNHGITLRGSVNTTTKDFLGLYAWEMLKWVCLAYCQGWITKDENFDSTNPFVVPHFAARDRGTPLSVIEPLLLLGNASAIYPMDWGVKEGREVFFKTPGTYGQRWLMRADQGLTPSDEGPDAAERINGVWVEYNPGDGKLKSVGPSSIDGAGSTGTFDSLSSALKTNDPNHPATRANITRMEKLPVVPITNLAGAILLGQLYLAEKNRNEWRGTLVHRGMPRGGSVVGSLAYALEQPPYMVRAGDTMVDDWDQRGTANLERRIVHTSYDSDTPEEIQMTIGADPDRFDALIARLGATIEAKGVG